MSTSKRWIVGCSALIAIALLSFAGAKAYYRLPAGWRLEGLRWRVMAGGGREDLANSYLASRMVVGLTRRDEVLADLGRPTETWDYWEYAVSSAGLGRSLESGLPRYAEAPILIVRFSADGRRVTEFLGTMVAEQPVPIDFSEEAWQSYTFFLDQRLPLADALIRGRQLRGSGREEIRRALGTPDFAECRLEYLVGPRSGGSGRYLVIELDENDRVIRAAVSDLKDR